VPDWHVIVLCSTVQTHMRPIFLHHFSYFSYEKQLSCGFMHFGLLLLLIQCRHRCSCRSVSTYTWQKIAVSVSVGRLCPELVYAAESYKKIIPLTLEPRYNPHGWLRFHTSDGLRYDFSSNDSFEESFKKLVRVLKKSYSSSGTKCQCVTWKKHDGVV